MASAVSDGSLLLQEQIRSGALFILARDPYQFTDYGPVGSRSGTMRAAGGHPTGLRCVGRKPIIDTATALRI